MFAATVQRPNGNASPSIPKASSLTGATTNLKKLLKSVRRLFSHSKSSKELNHVYHTCPTEEEHQNWLNEQLEVEKISLQ